MGSSATSSFKFFTPTSVLPGTLNLKADLSGAIAFRPAAALTCNYELKAGDAVAVAAQVIFNMSRAAVTGETVKVWWDNVLKTLTTHYTINGAVVTMVTAPGAGVVVDINFRKDTAAVIPAAAVTGVAPEVDCIVPTGTVTLEIM